MTNRFSTLRTTRAVSQPDAASRESRPLCWRTLAALSRLAVRHLPLPSLAASTVRGSLWVVLVCRRRGNRRTRQRSDEHDDGSEESISLLPMLFAAVLFGPLAGVDSRCRIDARRLHAAVPAVGASTRAAAQSRRPLLALVALGDERTIDNRATRRHRRQHRRRSSRRPALDIGLRVPHGLAPRHAGDPGRPPALSAPVALSAVPLYAPVVALLDHRDTTSSRLGRLMLFFVPALAAQRLYALYQQQRHLTEGLTSANEQLERANLSFAAALVATLDARDRYTAGHSAAVAVYSRDIAERMGLDEEDQQKAHLCGTRA